jgi:hypothetical protein
MSQSIQKTLGAAWVLSQRVGGILTSIKTKFIQVFTAQVKGTDAGMSAFKGCHTN